MRHRKRCLTVHLIVLVLLQKPSELLPRHPLVEDDLELVFLDELVLQNELFDPWPWDRRWEEGVDC